MPEGVAPDLAISIIIPTFNEADQIGSLVQRLQMIGGPESPLEIIVADGHSTDDTATLARAAGATVVPCPRKGRAAQLNYGAASSSGAILYFLHADSYPPPGFLAAIRQAVAAGYGSGCYRLAFDHHHWLLQASAWFTRFDVNLFRFGDQSLFVRRDVFEQVGGYSEKLLVMEDQEIIERLQRCSRFRVLPGVVTTSARKYLDNGVVRLQSIFGLICVLYRFGVSQPNLVRVYRKLIRQDKI
ncbi:TIGR04283 family arsenosugar biosynthesis glycosyltransferase [Hymenobacter sp. GOD-10R]|uniref:TIGR04283 family arsenosugar biosynthesis glycosyltransferase n=1 Tax=Hymenobacter sp. GOD-10R TaxID=3093922 RepID=UPI002D7763F3|nr:TIGR04283 family arsenosugar biosynthesis glycosyltransferase [Hymenobacter sp. GOD-10R]WRQ28259.1 TIGR04283 family arsenosugar biosynthesis glycosyltransferase [Hymenobacter sp. GOD-10R]